MNPLAAAKSARLKAQQQRLQQLRLRQQQIQSTRPGTSIQEIKKTEDSQDDLENCFRSLSIDSEKTDGDDLSIYRPLQNPAGEIRLMLLAPAAHIYDNVRCVLQTVTVAEAKTLNFSAISYACGDQSHRKDVSIGGARLSVTYNLHEALRNMRHPSEYRRIWADAICIAQSDLEEKSHQILLMREIYSVATEVFIWLGESDDDLDALFGRLSSIDPRDMQKQVAAFQTMFQSSQDPTEVSRAWIKLLQKPWFSRVWCVQEYMLASQTPILACGSSRAPWSVVNTALTTIDMLWPEKKSAYQIDLQKASTHSFVGAMEIQYRYWGKLDLGTALNYTSSKRATDPRDKIYAVLGLVSAETRRMLAPDYTQSLSSLYQRAMVAVCKEHFVLTPLSAAADTKTDPALGLPSWCLDFSDPHWQDAFVELHRFPLLYCNIVSGACGDRNTAPPGYLEYDSLTSRITVEGTVIGVIQGSLKMSFTPHIREHIRLERLRSLDNETFDESILSDLKSEIVYEFLNNVRAASIIAYNVLSANFSPDAAVSLIAKGAVWKTFDLPSITKQVFARIWKKNGLDLPAPDFGLFEAFLQSCASKPVPRTWSEVLSAEEKAAISQAQLIDDCIIKSCLAMARTIPDRAFIITDTGHAGQASTDVKAGDHVCVVFRCGQPLVLRGCGNERMGYPLYELVASAGVAGVMEGQIVKKGGYTRSRFVLK